MRTDAYRFTGDVKRQIRPFDLVYDAVSRTWVAQDPTEEGDLPALPYDFQPRQLPLLGKEVVQS